jgi:hypothetical protein
MSQGTKSCCSANLTHLYAETLCQVHEEDYKIPVSHWCQYDKFIKTQNIQRKHMTAIFQRSLSFEQNRDIDTIRSKMVPTQNENAQTCVAA